MVYTYLQVKELLIKEPLLNLYIVVGNDEYIISDCIRQIIYAQSEPDILRFDASDNLDLNALNEAFLSYPLLSKRLVIIDSFNPSKLGTDDKVFIESLIGNIPDFLTVVLSNCYEGKFSISKQYMKLAESVKNSVVISAAKPIGQQLSNLIEEFAKNQGASITRDAMNSLISLVGDDVFLLSQEIKKLAGLCKYTVIEKEHVLKLTVKSTESSVYTMISALEQCDLKKSLGVLKEMLDNKTDPFMISSVLNIAYINLYRAKLIVQSKVNRSDIYPLFDYREDDKKVSIALSRERDYSKVQLKTILEILFQLDIDLKSSSVSNALLVEQAIIEIAASRT